MFDQVLRFNAKVSVAAVAATVLDPMDTVAVVVAVVAVVAVVVADFHFGAHPGGAPRMLHNGGDKDHGQHSHHHHAQPKWCQVVGALVAARMAFHGGAVVHDHGEHHETEQGGKGTGRGDLKTHADEGHRRDGAQATGDPKSGGGKTPVGKDKQGGFVRVGGVVEMNGTRDQEEKTTEKDHDGFVQLEDDGGDIGRKNGGCFDEQWV